MKRKNKKKNKDLELIPKVDSREASKKELMDWVDKKTKEILDIIFYDVLSMKIKYSETGERGVVFTSQYSKPYRQLIITFFPLTVDIYKEGRADELMSGLFHEMAHIHTIPLSEMAKRRFTTEEQIEEYAEELTEILSKYLMLVFKNKHNKIKKEKIKL